MVLTLDSAELRGDDDNEQHASGSAGDDLNGVEDMCEDAIGEQGVVDMELCARKRIRAAFQGGVDALGSASESTPGPLGTGTLKSFQRPISKTKI
eukprot:4107432-Amphidinium_carterae.1